MKTTQSSNSHENSRKINHSVNHDKMREIAKLQGRNSADGREGSYKNEKFGKSGKEMVEEDNSTKNKFTGMNEKSSGTETDVRSEKSEKSGKKMTGGEDNSTKKEVTGKNEENVKSELEIRSEKQPEKGVEKDKGKMSGEKREHDPEGEYEEDKSDLTKDKDTSDGSWKKPYKGKGKEELVH